MPRGQQRWSRNEKNRFEALITCPVSLQIFKQPGKLLLSDGSDIGAVVEKEVYSLLMKHSNARCPKSKKRIIGWVRERELEYIVEWFLQQFPDRAVNQYIPTVVVDQPPAARNALINQDNSMDAVYFFGALLGLYPGLELLGYLVDQLWQFLYQKHFLTIEDDNLIFYMVLMCIISAAVATAGIKCLLYFADEPRPQLGRLGMFQAQPPQAIPIDVQDELAEQAWGNN